MSRHELALNVVACCLSLIGIYALIGSLFDWPMSGLALGAAYLAWGEATAIRADLIPLRRRGPS